MGMVIYMCIHICIYIYIYICTYILSSASVLTVYDYVASARTALCALARIPQYTFKPVWIGSPRQIYGSKLLLRVENEVHFL
jgi:hypothetical protein